MDAVAATVILVRLLVPFTIFRWPFFGFIAAMVADGADVFTIDLFQSTGWGNYHVYDKFLDTYFLVIAAIVSLKWDKLAKTTSMLLIGWRSLGFILFEIMQIRALFFFFPNLFEFYFLFEAGRRRFFPKTKMDVRKLAVVLLILAVPKMLQEYAIHYAQLGVWEWVKNTFFGWLFNT